MKKLSEVLSAVQEPKAAILSFAALVLLLTARELRRLAKSQARAKHP